MPIPAGVVRVSMVAQFRPDVWPAEEAVNTFHLVQQTGPTGPAPDPQYIADQVAAKFGTHWSSIAGMFPNAYQVLAFKTYLLDTSGHAIAQGVHAVPGGTLVGSATGGMLPPEVALALSLYAYTPGGFASQKGRKRGRIYLGPLAASLLDVTGLVFKSNMDDFLVGWQALFNDINTIESASGRTDPMGLVVLSHAAGATYEITTIAYDDHFDAQRRRQRQTPPTRHTQPITAW